VPTGTAIDAIAVRLEDERRLESPRAAYFQLGLHLLASGRTAPATDAFERAAKEVGATPSAGVLTMALGQASAQAGASDRALRAFLEAALDLPSMFVPLVDAAFGVLRTDSATIQRRWLNEAWLPQATRTNLPPPERGLMQALAGAAMLMVGDATRAIEHFAALRDTERGETWQALLARVGTLALPTTIAAGDGERTFLLGRIADSLGQTEAALDSVDRALELGFTDKSGYPDAPAHALRGKLLAQLGRKADAVDSYLAAEQRYLWRNEVPEALVLLKSARALDETSIAICWRLADALLMASYVSKPPWVDKDKIEESLGVWSRAANVELPDEDYYWAYLTRAKIAQQLANLPGADRWQCYWETVTFVEQALLLNPTRTLSWVIVGQMHYALGNDQNALHATETALLCDPEDVNAIEQRIILLTNLDRYTEVRPLLAKLRSVDPSVHAWMSAIEAHIALYETPSNAGHQAYEAALAASEAAVKASEEAPWIRIDRARLLRLVGRAEDAKQEFEDLWRKSDQKDVDNQLFYAWAALMTGKVHEAIGIFDGCSGDRVCGLSTIQRYLGFCHLLDGKLETARDHLVRAIDLANSARELDVWLVRDFEATDVLELLTGRPHADQAREILDQCKTSAKMRRATLQGPSSPLEEMQRIIAALEESTDTAGWSWIGAHAAAARLNLEAHYWRDAEGVYRMLQDYPGCFFTAQHGLEQALFGLAAEERGTPATLGAAHAASDLESISTTAEGALPEDRARLAGIHDQRADLDRRRRPTRLFGQLGMQRLLAVTPIAIEAAGNLGPLLQGDDGDLTPQFAEYLKLMRWGLDDLFGFTVPTARVRINQSDLPDGTYIILLNEIPLVSGNIDLTRGLCNETVDRLALLNVKGEEAINPANGSECSWVGQGDWQKVKDADLDIWTPAEYIILHLSAVIRKNPTELVGIQAVVDLLRDKAEEQYSRILSAQGGLPRFTSVLQALLAEEVPIKELPSICDCYLDSLNLPTYDIPEEIRCLEAVRKDILGNTPDTPIYRLGENLVSLIAHGIQRDGEAAVLALEPEPTQDALTAVRNEVANLPPISRNPVIFVEDWRMRPFVRKLVELEFPHLAVLSRREALDPDSRHVLATIEVEFHPHSESR
jgi:tetratricopeptide (TPR) repeat protein